MSIDCSAPPTTVAAMKSVESECHFLTIQESRGPRLVHLTSLTYSLGRSSKSTIVLASSSISREHALLLRMPSREPGKYLFRLIDGNASGKPSLNGFSVNGEKRSVHDLCDGDEIIFGGMIHVTYEIRAADAMTMEDAKGTLASHSRFREEDHTVLAEEEKKERQAMGASNN